MEKTKSPSTTPTVRPIRVIHTTIRSNVNKNKSIYSNHSIETHPSRSTNSQKNLSKQTNLEQQLKQDSLNNFSARSKVTSAIDSETSYRSCSKIKGTLSAATESQTSNVRVDVYGTTEDLWPKSQKNRKTKYRHLRRCYYLYICICISLCCAILLATSIAALLVGLSINKSKPSTTIQSIIQLTDTNVVLYGLWNTTAGNDGTLSAPGSSFGNYNPNETPENAFDQNITSKYTSYGNCNRSDTGSVECGANTGLYLTLQQGVLLLASVRFCTAPTLPERDPMTMTIEGSNQSSSVLLLGSSWTLIYNGTTGLDSDPGRSSEGVTETVANSISSYNSYRILITAKRNVSNAVQYSELELYGY